MKFLIIFSVAFFFTGGALMLAAAWRITRDQDRDAADTEQPLPRMNRPPVQPWDRVRPPVRWHNPGPKAPVDDEAGDGDD